MLEKLKAEVAAANRMLPQLGLVSFTWGNVSGIDRASGLIVIKPSGVAYEALTAEKMVVVRLSDGAVVEGELRPSSDTPTHRVLYEAFPEIGGCVHTHSTYAVGFAQACLPIPALGTTHADCFHGDIPLARPLTEEEIRGAYEENTGRTIVEAFAALDPTAIPAVLCAFHGPFAWGRTPAEAVEHIAVAEECARMAFISRMLRPDGPRLPQALADKHYERKHGKDAYYGQK